MRSVPSFQSLPLIQGPLYTVLNLGFLYFLLSTIRVNSCALVSGWIQNLALCSNPGIKLSSLAKTSAKASRSTPQNSPSTWTMSATARLQRTTKSPTAFSPFGMHRYSVILDTNVILAALRSRTGASHRLLMTLRHPRWQSVITPALMYEYEDVSRRPGNAPGLTSEEITNILDLLYQESKRQLV
jgi:hypothetical protein